jgi:16S rRNA (guanine966-N2)-methyltransferase
MRIIAGAFGGRRLHTPKGTAIRPTADRVREAVFSIIGPAVAGAEVLDLFAGTGAMGLEALSRGASRAVFVDQSLHAVRLIRSNVALCKVAERVSVIHGPVNQAIRRLAGLGEAFDLIFSDPPYGKHAIQKILPTLGEVVRPGTLVVAEHGSREPLPAQVQEWSLTEKRQYGDTSISFYMRE